MSLGAQVSYREHWSTVWDAARVLNAVGLALKHLDARMINEAPLRLESKVGKLRHILLRSPARWPMRIDIELTPTASGSEAVLAVRSDVPFGARRGSEASYLRGIISVAETLRGEVAVLELHPHC